MNSALLGLILLGFSGLSPETAAPEEDSPDSGADEDADPEDAAEDAPAEDAPAEDDAAPEDEPADDAEDEPADDAEDEPADDAEDDAEDDAAPDDAEPEPEPEPESEPEPQPQPEPVPAPAPTLETSTTIEQAAPAHREPRVLETIQSFREEEVAYHANKRDDFRFVPGFQVRNQVGWISGFQMDRDGNRYGEGALDTGRIRWNPRFQFGVDHNLELIAQIDAVNGRWAPDGSNDPVIQEIISPPPSNAVAVGQPPGRQTLRFVDPRHLFLQWTTKIGQLRLGQMGFTWGLGILANDGNNVDRFGDLKFGEDGPGDIYERILFGTRPFSALGDVGRRFVLAVGGDLIFRDERTQLLKDVDGDGRLQLGDVGGQAIFVLRYQPEATPWNWVGAYAVYRKQNNAEDHDVYEDDGELEVGVGDLAGQGVHWLRDDLQLIGAFEGALIGGRTTWARNERGTHRVLQGGAAARGYIGDADRWLVGLDAGFASGDRNPTDQWITNFTFDQGHTAGLVLFQQVQGWRTARSEILATNGALTGEALNGTQFIPTRGAITNAVYVHPKARWAFKRWFEVWGGPLIAAAPMPIVDPFATRLAGGTPTNSVLGDGNKRYYGTELDLGARARYDVNNLWLQIGIQGGILLPGSGLANQAGENEAVVGALWLRTEIRY